MTTLNKTEKKTINNIVKYGFTFYGDNLFSTFTQAKRCLDGLVRKGYALKDGDEFKPTEAAKYFVKYGITI